MNYLHDAECDYACLDKVRLNLICKRLDSALKDLHVMGLILFSSGEPTIRLRDPERGDLIVASLSATNAEGGVDDTYCDEIGLQRGLT